MTVAVTETVPAATDTQEPPPVGALSSLKRKKNVIAQYKNVLKYIFFFLEQAAITVSKYEHY